MENIKISPDYQIHWPTKTEFCHHGIPLSNGVFGALVWFQGNQIMITINRADFWDHRGGTVWTKDCTYENLTNLLQKGEFSKAKELFHTAEHKGIEKRPTRLPMGRIEIQLQDHVKIKAAHLDLLKAEANFICLINAEEKVIKFSVLMGNPVVAVAIDKELIKSINERPAYDFKEVKAYFDHFGISQPLKYMEEDVSGWIQELPEDEPCAVLQKFGVDSLLITSNYGKHSEEAVLAAKGELQDISEMNYEVMTGKTKEAWELIWKRTADIELPDKELEKMYYLGIYKMLGNSMPGKIAPTLQGPWVEEFRMPPWSSDYHFNINVQECLWPAYASNNLACLKPLFQLIEQWKPLMATKAEAFIGTNDGYQLNHACDDRGTTVDSFWTGAIDHGNTSWIAQMMWLYTRYSGDEKYLLEEVYPFMKKTMNVYMKMMKKDGGRYIMPVTVSPEYGGAENNAWGANSSFFLANVHFLCNQIIRVVEMYNLEDEQAYSKQIREIKMSLPPYTKGKGSNGKDEIYLWEGQALDESHRHHSHLAGIYPFETITAEDEQHKEIIQNSYQTWITKGMGAWAGWSMPWASILHGRIGSKEMAYYCLKVLQDVFMMPGFSTSHNAQFPGVTLFTGGGKDFMQIEASIAASAAVLELFVQSVNGEIQIFSGMPDRFKDVSFSGIRTEGAFLISAEMKNGLIQEISIFSEKGNPLTLRLPFLREWQIIREGDDILYTQGNVVQLETEIGESLRIHPRNS